MAPPIRLGSRKLHSLRPKIEIATLLSNEFST